MSKMFTIQSLLKSLFVSFLVAVWLLGCEEGVEPFVGDEHPFTIWGFMDAANDTQKVRVFSIEERLGLDRSGPIDAVVTSTDLHTGEVREWVDSEVTYNNGSVGHVFWSDFQAEFEHSYRLEVTRSDGASVSVEVTLPLGVEVELDRISKQTLLPVFIKGDPPEFIKLEMEYDVSSVPPATVFPRSASPPLAYRYPVTISYADELKQVNDGWEVLLNMPDDFRTIQREFENVCLGSKYISLRKIEFRFLVAFEEWVSPVETFDPEVLIQPGTFSNVENGYGFFGAGYAVNIRWTPPFDVVGAIGFAQSSPCSGFSANPTNPDCVMPPDPCFPPDFEGY